MAQKNEKLSETYHLRVALVGLAGFIWSVKQLVSALYWDAFRHNDHTF